MTAEHLDPRPLTWCSTSASLVLLLRSFLAPSCRLPPLISRSSPLSGGVRPRRSRALDNHISLGRRAHPLASSSSSSRRPDAARLHRLERDVVGPSGLCMVVACWPSAALFASLATSSGDHASLVALRGCSRPPDRPPRLRRPRVADGAFSIGAIRLCHAPAAQHGSPPRSRERVHAQRPDLVDGDPRRLGPHPCLLFAARVERLSCRRGARAAVARATSASGLASSLRNDGGK